MNSSKEKEEGNEESTINLPEIDKEKIDLSLIHTQEDDLQNQIETFEERNRYLRSIRLKYSTSAILGSFLLIVIIFIEVFSSRDSSIKLNITLIVLGAIGLIICFMDYILLMNPKFKIAIHLPCCSCIFGHLNRPPRDNRCAFISDEEWRNIERHLYGLKVHIKRENSHVLHTFINELRAGGTTSRSEPNSKTSDIDFKKTNLEIDHF